MRKEKFQNQTIEFTLYNFQSFKEIGGKKQKNLTKTIRLLSGSLIQNEKCRIQEIMLCI